LRTKKRVAQGKKKSGARTPGDADPKKRKVYVLRGLALDKTCPRCHAKPGDACHSRDRTVKMHQARRRLVRPETLAESMIAMKARNAARDAADLDPWPF
jgi:hypothetical protein